MHRWPGALQGYSGSLRGNQAALHEYSPLSQHCPGILQHRPGSLQHRPGSLQRPKALLKSMPTCVCRVSCPQRIALGYSGEDTGRYTVAFSGRSCNLRLGEQTVNATAGDPRDRPRKRLHLTRPSIPGFLASRFNHCFGSRDARATSPPAEALLMRAAGDLVHRVAV